MLKISEVVIPSIPDTIPDILDPSDGTHLLPKGLQIGGNLFDNLKYTRRFINGRHFVFQHQSAERFQAGGQSFQFALKVGEIIVTSLDKVTPNVLDATDSA